MTKSLKIGVVVFPGSNCDQDAFRAAKNVAKAEAVWLWHKDADLKNVDAVIIPGGFSYGDYLRCGAMAKNAPIMAPLIASANAGLPVIGICNGFQILTESGLLPGVLMRNERLKFICKTVHLTVENTNTAFTKSGKKNQNYKMPIAHMEGNYFIDTDGLKSLEDNNQIVFRYVDDKGSATADANPNGALKNIAGICNKAGNVVGLMPHPERVCDAVLGGVDGRFIFESLL